MHTAQSLDTILSTVGHLVKANAPRGIIDFAEALYEGDNIGLPAIALAFGITATLDGKKMVIGRTSEKAATLAICTYFAETLRTGRAWPDAAQVSAKQEALEEAYWSAYTRRCG